MTGSLVTDQLDLSGLPKAELHVHLEGTMEPSTMLSFARRNGVVVPWPGPDEVRAAYAFTGLTDFLALYWQGCQVLCTRADFYDLTLSYLQRAFDLGVRWVELSFAPQNFLPRGITIADQLGGIAAAIADAGTMWGVRAAVVVVVQRHKSEAEALELLELVQPHRETVVAVGLGGPEIGHPASKFSRMFLTAAQRGYRLTAHAGEEGPPAYVRDAIAAGVERVDHGYAAASDDALIARLAKERISVTMCPLSNLRLHVTDDLGRYPLKRFLDAGVAVSINSDDPPYFQGNVNDNFAAVIDALQLDRADVVQLARHSFTSSFAPPEVIASGLRELSTWPARPDVGTSADHED